MNQNLKTLFDLYLEFTNLLTNTKTLLNGLKTLPLEMIVVEGFENIGNNFPPVKVEKTTETRIAELERDEKVLTARINSIKAAIIEELNK